MRIVVISVTAAGLALAGCAPAPAPGVPVDGLPAANVEPPAPTDGSEDAPADAPPARADEGEIGFTLSDLPGEWDGRQTAGGLWVALPWPPAYRRVLVRDPETGRAVVAKLFWRDSVPGEDEALLSSAAAQALGVKPGARPLTFSVLKGE